MILRTLRYAASVILRRAWGIASGVAPARSGFRRARQSVTGKRYPLSNFEKLALQSWAPVTVFSVLLDGEKSFDLLTLKRGTVTVAVCASSGDMYAARRSWAPRAYPN